MKYPGKMSSGPNVPRRNDQKKDQHVVPMEKCAESETGLTVKNSEQRKNGDQVDQPENTVGQTGEGRANPETGEPDASMLPALVTTDRAKHPAGDKSAEDWLRHDDPPEDRSTAGAEINPTRQKAMPVM